MLLYTLAIDQAASRIARANGVDDAFSFETSRVCVPLDSGSLRRSWARMAMVPPLKGDLIELLEVDGYEAVTLWHALDATKLPSEMEVEDIRFPTDPARLTVFLPRNLCPLRMVRMSAERLADGDLDDYVTDEVTRDALLRAIEGLHRRLARGVPIRSRLTLTGVAAFAWAQATRTDLAPEILSVTAGDLVATDGANRALRMRGNRRKRKSPEHRAEALHAMESGLDELAHRLVERRARTLGITADLPCYCGSGRPYGLCCGTKGLDEIARDW